MGFGVSIPFKRESSSELLKTALDQVRRDEVSIPFKRESSSELNCGDCCWMWFHVSIPFKRESSSELS